MRVLTALCVGLLVGVAAPSTVAAWQSLPSTFTAPELAYLTERMGRDGTDRALDRRVTDALGLTQADGPPLTLRYLGITSPSHGDAYFFAPLPDGRMLLGRRDFTGRIFSWLVLPSDSAPRRAILAVMEGTAPLADDQADAEQRRIVAFLRSNVPAPRSGN